MRTSHCVLLIFYILQFNDGQVNGLAGPLPTGDENAYPTPVQLAIKHGYNAESHNVTTDDGYILTLHRIFGCALSPPNVTKPVVFLMHGILASSACWVMEGPEIPFGFLLVNAGYDVWMGNARGNTYSRAHKWLSPDNNAFWDFCWHDIALHDLPAMIDYILNYTNKPKLFYVGHSQGTTVLFVLLSIKVEYNGKIITASFYAPIGIMTHLKSPAMRIFCNILIAAAGTFEVTGYTEFISTNIYMAETIKILCTNNTDTMCMYPVFLFTGFNEPNTNMSLLPEYTEYLPAGASIKQFLHYCQELFSGKFCQYDYGLLGNIIKYGRNTPPEYDLSKIRIKTYWFYSGNDWLSAPEDVMTCASKIVGATLVEVHDLKFDHLDYTWGMNATETYNRTLALMSPYN